MAPIVVGVMPRLAMGLVALTLGAAATLEAQDPDLSDFHRFQLLTRCEEVLLSSVAVSGDTAEEIGLTEERVRAMAEGRLISSLATRSLSSAMARTRSSVSPISSAVSPDTATEDNNTSSHLVRSWKRW